MKVFQVFALLFLVLSSLHADIYKWTDSNGIVHFSDVPHPGAKKINIAPEQSSTPSSVPDLPQKQMQSASKEAHVYQSVSIKEPKNEATIRNNQGYIPVIIEVDPELIAGDLVQLIFDGNPLGKPQTSLLFALNEVKRGTHTLGAQIVDAEGEVLAASDSITVFMHRPMVSGTKPKNP